MAVFTAERVGEWARWDATGRINVLHRANEATLDDLVANGLREIALGIESASPRILQLIDKRISADMTTTVVRRLASRGIDVKGYFILGFPTETPEDIDATVALIHHLWEITDRLSGTFTASVFEYRPSRAPRTGTVCWVPATPRPNCSTTTTSTSPWMAPTP
jgi:radical SAM superfamily enzyme YgiQ (UPF0313 family)